LSRLKENDTIKVILKVKEEKIKMYYVDSFIKNTFSVPQPEGRRPYIRLDQNENPDGLPKWFFDKVMKEITPSYLATYPEEGVLTEKFAKKVGVNTDQVTLTDGSF
jgi:histidinol-phosphate aminotransferase